MSEPSDRLYQLLPAYHRMRDEERGFPLRALLRVVGEQADVIEQDIAQLYENSFIETCDDWAVPYIGDLVGYRAVHEAGEPGAEGASAERNRVIIPRREIANTIALRRRKGALALLELLARDAAGWPARAVEFYKLLGWTQQLDHLHLKRARSVDLRDGAALDRLNSPFDTIGHTIDVRRVGSRHQPGRHNIGSVGLFVFRLRSYSVTHTATYCQEGQGARRYSFSVLGNDAPLFVNPQQESDPERIAQEVNLPVRLRRRALRGPDGLASAEFYGPGKSLSITAPDWPRKDAPQPLPAALVLVADLSDWNRYKTPRGHVAVDPVLGRIAFPESGSPRNGVSVTYHYGFSADIGGGEYPRSLLQAAGAKLYRVGHKEEIKSINAALEKWQAEKQARRQAEPAGVLAAVIELCDSGVYTEALGIVLEEGESLQLRAANGKRPVLRLLDQVADRADAFSIIGQRASRFVLDGLLVTGRGLRISGPDGREGGDLCDVRIRHTTLVPGWGVHCDCEPKGPNEPSLELVNTTARVTIEHSIIGSIFVTADEVARDPMVIEASDSIIDATSEERVAIGSSDQQMAFASLRIVRCTVIGQVLAHALILGENSLFAGLLRVARRQVGCVRFCYVMPGSRTPRRFQCQPDLAEQAVPAGDAEAAGIERLRVKPVFTSVRYGQPGYCQLHLACAPEISGGADDESEMGVFHDLYQPQRAANLRTRLNEYTPAAMEAGIIYGT